MTWHLTRWKNWQHMAKIIILVGKTMNPSSENIPKEQLYNTRSGKTASQETTNFLLTCKQIGSNAREKFIEEDIADKKCFEKKIVPGEGQHICKWRYKIYCKEWQKQVGWGEYQKRFIWKYIVLFCTAKKKRYRGILTYPLTLILLTLHYIDGWRSYCWWNVVSALYFQFTWNIWIC